MIQWMHGTVAKWILRFLAVFLIVSFAAWGIEDMIRPASDISDVAEVDGSVIGRNEVSLQFSRLMNTMRSRLGPDFDTQQAVQLGLLDQILDQMINARLISIDANRLGLNAGEEEIRQAIFNDQRFRGIGDRFDRNRFRQYLAQEGMPEAAFIATTRDQIIRGQVAGALGAATTVPKILQETLFKYRNEKRVAEIVSIRFGKISEIAAPSDSELVKFHKENPGLFAAPEYRQVVSIYLDPDAMAKGQSPSENRIKEEFEDRRPSLAVPERRTVEQTLLPDEEKAKKLLQEIKSGKSFADTVKDATGNLPISLGALSKLEMPDQAIGAAAFALTQGTMSEPIKSPLGWHILQVTKIVPGIEPELKDHRKRIITELAREMAVDEIIKLTGKLDDTLAGGARIEDASSTIGVKILKIDAVDREGRDPKGKPVKSLPKSPAFLERVFTAGVGENTNVEETRDSAFFVLRVDNITAPALRPLKDVRAKAIEEWKKKNIQSATRKLADKLQNAAKAAASLRRAAKSNRRKIVTSKPFTRFIREPGSRVSNELSTALFGAKKGDIVVGATPTGFAVASLKEIIPADPKKNQADARNLKEQLRSALTTDALSQYLAALRQQYKVDINRTALDSIAGGNSGG
jgi:peptidyl-prolyl cis-trans isomerase D